MSGSCMRYESHKDFLNHGLAEKLAPKDLRLELEPTIGNYDPGFVDTWYAKLKSFSLTLMKDIASYYDKTIVQTKQNIRETKIDLRSVTVKEEYFQIEETIKTNEAKKNNKNAYYINLRLKNLTA